jgi:hypothetical protein
MMCRTYSWLNWLSRSAARFTAHDVLNTLLLDLLVPICRKMWNTWCIGYIGAWIACTDQRKNVEHMMYWIHWCMTCLSRFALKSAAQCVEHIDTRRGCMLCGKSGCYSRVDDWYQTYVIEIMQHIPQWMFLWLFCDFFVTFLWLFVTFLWLFRFGREFER